MSFFISSKFQIRQGSLSDAFVIEHHKLGRIAELAVSNRFAEAGWQIYFRNQKIAGVEVDFVATNDRSEWALVEVKTLKDQVYSGTRITKRQKQRLYRVSRWLNARFGSYGSIVSAFFNSSTGSLDLYDQNGEVWHLERGEGED